MTKMEIISALASSIPSASALLPLPKLTSLHRSFLFHVVASLVPPMVRLALKYLIVVFYMY